MDKKTKDKIEELDKQLVSTCKEIYELSMGGKRLKPLHPFILVRVLPKEHKTEAGLWLADTAQTKTVYEGIVLETWESYIEKRELYNSKHEFIGHDYIEHRCRVDIGERIAFPHHEGMPVGDYLDDRYYRLVREGTDQNKWPYCGVLGTLDYTGDVVLKAKLREITKEFSSVTLSGVALSRGADTGTPYGTK